tara:strand:+ start:191 stop:442 length:252 start_codon:yes stop_codon:yes gene_type:complete
MPNPLEALSDPLNTIITENGPFAGGVCFGSIMSYFFFSLASKERKARFLIDQERERELFKQNGIKDKRIDKLHQELRKEQKRK